MPTKTKPIAEWAASWSPSIRLSDERRAEVAALLQRDIGALDQAFDEIERALTLGTRLVNHHETSPLPAHLLAELEPVTKQAHELAERINRLSLTARVSVPDTLDLWHLLSAWSCSASIECDRLKHTGEAYQAAVKQGRRAHVGGSDGGARKRNVRGAKETVDEALRNIYRAYSKAPTLRDERRFLKIVAPRRRDR